MKNKKLIYKNDIPKKYLSRINNKNFNKKYLDIIKDILNNFDNDHSIFSSLNEKFQLNFKIKDLNKFKNFKTVAIIGMGGSILGSEAIYNFLKKKTKKAFLFLDNIDQENLRELKATENLNNILFIVISKSGNTIETISNLLSLKIVKKKSKNIIIISEKKNNLLYTMAQKFKLNYIEHKKNIRGRYSVLSEVGMVPAYLMGFNVLKFKKNLHKKIFYKNRNFLKRSSIILSQLLKNNKFKNLIFFNYTPELEKFLYWTQQLIAESLGKKEKGFLPVVSQAPRDHHSLLQLYLDGPKDKIFYIFSKKFKIEKMNRIKTIESKTNFLNNKSLNQIKEAQKNAFINVLKNNKIPYREFIISDFDEETIGELFSYFMIETAIVGKLSNINPFDQPAVEQVKINTVKLLR